MDAGAQCFTSSSSVQCPKNRPTSTPREQKPVRCTSGPHRNPHPLASSPWPHPHGRLRNPSLNTSTVTPTQRLHRKNGSLGNWASPSRTQLQFIFVTPNMAPLSLPQTLLTTTLPPSNLFIPLLEAVCPVVPHYPAFHQHSEKTLTMLI